MLTPNLKGLEAALPSRPDEIVVFGAASEAFSQRNINCSDRRESIERFRPVVAAAHEHGIKVRAAISCALGCPYQGEVSARRGRARRAADEGDRRRPLRRRRHDRRRHAAARAGGDGARAEALPARRGQRPFPRHLRPGAGQHLRLPRAGHPHLRRQRRRPRRLPVREGRDRQRRDRGRALHAATASASRPASTSTRSSTPAPSSPACSAARRSRAPARRCSPSARRSRHERPSNERSRPEGFRRVAAGARRSAAIRMRRVWLEVAARTSQEAADALGVVGRPDRQERDLPAQSDDAAVLVVTSGDRRVDEKKVAAQVGAARSCRRRVRQGAHRLHDRRRGAGRRMPRRR